MSAGPSTGFVWKYQSRRARERSGPGGVGSAAAALSNSDWSSHMPSRRDYSRFPAEINPNSGALKRVPSEVLERMALVERAKRDRRDARRWVHKLTLTKSERDILLAIVNLWFAHRYGDGIIRPGRQRLAKKAGVKVITVARALAKFRSLGFIKDVAYSKGGTGKTTHYTVDMKAIGEAAEPCTVETVLGVLIPFTGRQTVSSGSENDTVCAYQNDTLTRREHSYVFPEPEGETDWSEVPF